MADYILLEDASGHILLEDGSGAILLEEQTAGAVTGTSDVSFGWSDAATAAEDIPGTSDAAFGWSDSATGAEDIPGTAASTFGWSDTANAAEDFPATAASTFGWSDDASGAAGAAGTADSAFGWSDAATAGEDIPGTSDTAFGWSDSASGTVGALDITGTSDATFGWSDTAAGTEDIPGTAASTFGWSHSATAAEEFSATSATTFTWSDAATASEDFPGTAASSFGWSDAATAAEDFPATAASTFGWSDTASGTVTTGGVPYIDPGLGFLFRKVWADPDRASNISPFVVATYPDDHIGEPGQYMTVYNRFTNGASQYSIHDGMLDLFVTYLGSLLWDACLLATSVGGSDTAHTYGQTVTRFWSRFLVGDHTWPTTWLYDTTTWSADEIDWTEILENQNLRAAVHGIGAGSVSGITVPGDVDTVFHEYKIERRSSYTAFFIDGVEKGRVTATQSTKSLAIMLDAKIGFPWGYAPSGGESCWIQIGGVTVDKLDHAYGTAATSFGYSDAASGTVVGGDITGTAASTFGWSDTASGEESVSGAADSTFGWETAATAQEDISGDSEVTFLWATEATGAADVFTVVGTAASEFGWHTDASWRGSHGFNRHTRKVVHDPSSISKVQ